MKDTEKYFIASDSQRSFFDLVKRAGEINLIMKNVSGASSCNSKGQVLLERIHWLAGETWYEGYEDVITREVDIETKGDNPETPFHFHVKWPRLNYAYLKLQRGLMFKGEWYRISFHEIEKDENDQTMLFGFYTQTPEFFEQFLTLQEPWFRFDPPRGNLTLRIN